MNSKDLTKLILQLLEQKNEVSVLSIAQAGGLLKSSEAHRKAIRRALAQLERDGLVTPHGAGRSRVYMKATQTFDQRSFEFKDILLSSESEELLQYVSQSITARNPVGYNQNFLLSYQPNESFYLSPSQRHALHGMGPAEIQNRPAGTYARNILNRLLIDLSWNSSRLEGNTYSLLETQQLIERGEIAAGKDASESQMILNHKAAIEYVVESAGAEALSSHEVCSIHALLSENLLGDPGATGRLRSIAVGIGGSTYIPLENPYNLKEFFGIFIEKFNLIEDVFEQSIFALIQLSYMQVFEDVNKRTARLVANIPLIKKNYRPLSFTDVNKDAYVKALLGVYEKNNISLICDLYIWAYKRSSQRYSAVQQSMGEPNSIKLKYRELIREIVRKIVIEKIGQAHIVLKIKNLLQAEGLTENERKEIFEIIELEIYSLHEGNIARFKIRPSEFQAWKRE